jgi:hypothetical protein
VAEIQPRVEGEDGKTATPPQRPSQAEMQSHVVQSHDGRHNWHNALDRGLMDFPQRGGELATPVLSDSPPILIWSACAVLIRFRNR